MNTAPPEFYAELAGALEACSTDEERGRVFNEIHEKYGVDSDAVNRDTFNTWAVRIECTPPALEEDLSATEFNVRLNVQEMQAIVLSQSEHGQQLLRSEEFDRLRQVLGRVMRRITESSQDLLPVLEELYDKHSDAILEMANEAQQRAEGGEKDEV